MPTMFGSGLPATLAEKLWRVEWALLFVASLIAAAGTATLYSVSGGTFEPYAERHALRFLVGLALVLAMAATPPRIWLALSSPAYVAALALLAIVPVVGAEQLGARRWLQIGGLSIQPSEPMKLALVAALAHYYHWLPRSKVSHPLWLVPPLGLIALPAAATLIGPDLGSAILLGATGLAVMFLAGVSWVYFAAAAVCTAAAAPVLWGLLYGYQRRRIEIFLDPGKDPLGAGYHITQSKIALGSGGLTGRGFLGGTQSQLDFVPEKHTDFAFTIFAEEWGFVGAVAIIALFVLMIVLLLRIALRSSSAFGRLVVAGVAVVVALTAFVNMAMVAGLVPVVGVPLPLFSYGGTAQMTLMAGLGLAMSVHVHSRSRLSRQPWRLWL